MKVGDNLYGLVKYGELQYGEGYKDPTPDITKVPDLMKYLPSYYQKSSITKELQNAIAQEFGAKNYELEDIEKQINIDTATWGLIIYEREVGLETNVNITYEERREILKSKWQSRGVATKKMIKNTAESFSGGEVEVIEYPKEDFFIVKFIGVKGIPRNMPAFINMLEDIKPAHLAYDFEYILVVWQMLKDKNVTWQEAKDKGLTWNDLRQYKINETGV